MDGTARDTNLLSSGLNSDVIKPCWKSSLCLQDTSHCELHFICYFASKGPKLPISITAARLQEGLKKISREQIDCEAFRREEIWQVILFQKHVIRNNHFPFTLLFSDEQE